MEEYWKIQPRAEQTTPSTTHAASHNANSTSIMSKFDRHRLSLLTEIEEGWSAELRRYLKDMPADVMKDTDVVKWWQVRVFITVTSYGSAIVTCPHAGQPRYLSNTGLHRT